MAHAPRPRRREDFEIAIICALAIESDAVEGVFDSIWEDEEGYGKAPGDPNAYTTGRIGNHNVVMAFMPGIGKAASASVAASFRASFPSIKLGLVVGVCGAVPVGKDQEEILLGDVIISTGIIQVDFGRQFPDKVIRKDTLHDNLGRPNSEIRAFLNKMAGNRSRTLLKDNSSRNLVNLLQKQGFEKSQYPGSSEDRLYPLNYRHKHQNPTSCSLCARAVDDEDEICETARSASCTVLRCRNDLLLPRDRLGVAVTVEYNTADGTLKKIPVSEVHFGLMASGDLVMKSGQHRDDLAQKEGVIAFEMEGAGIWDNFPTIVVKGVCDYADSHKNKSWQRYAAANAAACLKALLKQWTAADGRAEQVGSPHTKKKNSWLQSNCVSFPNRALRPVKQFVERRSITLQLKNRLVTDENVDNKPSRIVVVHGIGGVGKSQVVLDYVKAHQSDYSMCFWLQAGDKESLERDFVQLYRMIFEKMDVKRDALPTLEDMVLAVRLWISERHGRRLLVLDGADDIAGDIDHVSLDLTEFIPNGPLLDVIITTRNALGKEMGTEEAIEVGKMEPPEAVDLFCKNINFRQRPKQSDLLLIVHELGYLALAITLAGHYISRNPRLRSNIAEYLPEYRKERKKHLERRPLKLIHQYDLSVIATWEISLEAVRLRSEPAALFLNIIAFLDPRDIFTSMFFPKNDTELTASEKTWHQVLSNNKTLQLYDVEEMFRYLEEYSLIQLPAASETPEPSVNGLTPDGYQMHKLVHDWCYERQSIPDQARFGLASLQILKDITKTSNENLTLRLRLVPHVSKATDLLSTLNLAKSEDYAPFADTLWPLSTFLEDMGRHQENERLRKFHVRCCVISNGEIAQNSLTAMHNLACNLADSGRLDDALVMHRDILEKRQRVLGNDNMDTVSSMNSLAHCLGKKGRSREALLMKEEVLRRREAYYGRQHDSTIIALNNLACDLDDAGHYARAESMKREVLGYRLSHNGVSHADTLTAIENLAVTLSHRGFLKDAVSLNDEVIEGRKKLLGIDHPLTLNSLSIRGACLRDAGLYKEAVAQDQETFERQLHILGPKHPNTLATMNNLGVALSKLGNYQEALSVKKNLIAISEHTHGREHPLHLRSLANLAGALKDLGKFQEAEQIFRDVLDTRKRILSNEDPDTARTMHDLASVLSSKGNYEEALKFSDMALEHRERLLGTEHPLTLSTKNDKNVYLVQLKRIEEAHVLAKEVAESRERVLGTKHPDTLLSQGNLAYTTEELGNTNEALIMNRRLVDQWIDLKGEDFPEAMTAMSNLAGSLQAVRNLDEAVLIQERLIDRASVKYGATHKKTLLYMHNLAFSKSLQGKVHEAATMERRVLTGRERSLGVTHPDTILAARHLAGFLMEEGNLDEAKIVVKAALTTTLADHTVDREQALKLRRVLLNILWKQENFDLAEEEEVTYLNEAKVVYGSGHKQISIALNTHGVNVMDYRKDFVRAAEILRHSLAIREQPPGSEDYFTTEIMMNLAVAMFRREDYPASAKLYQNIVDARHKICGEKFENLDVPMFWLSSMLWNAQQNDAAEEVQRRHLDMTITHLGRHHETSLTRLNQLACKLLEPMKKYEEAEAIFFEVMQVRRSMTGASASSLYQVTRNLAAVYHRQSRDGESEALLQELLDTQLKTLTMEEQEVRTTVEFLVGVLRAQGKMAEVEKWEKILSSGQTGGEEEIQNA